MSTFLDPFDISTPIGSEDRSLGDDRIREFKRAFKERYEVEHSLPTASGAGSGRHKFAYGTTAARPTDPVTGSIYFNTQTGAVEQYDGAAWQTRAVAADSTKLPLAGGTMTGNIVLPGNPSSALQAAPKQYVDTMLPKAGGAMTGAIDLGGVAPTNWAANAVPAAAVAATVRNGSTLVYAATQLASRTEVQGAWVTILTLPSVTFPTSTVRTFWLFATLWFDNSSTTGLQWRFKRDSTILHTAPAGLMVGAQDMAIFPCFVDTGAASGASAIYSVEAIRNSGSLHAEVGSLLMGFMWSN